jgi:hypothetical protein
MLRREKISFIENLKTFIKRSADERLEKVSVASNTSRSISASSPRLIFKALSEFLWAHELHTTAQLYGFLSPFKPSSECQHRPACSRRSWLRLALNSQPLSGQTTILITRLKHILANRTDEARGVS